MKTKVTTYIFLILTSYLFCHSANAYIVKNLYTIESSIADNSVETRNKLLPQALDQVLLKVVGSKSILSDPQLAIAREHVDKYVTSYSYTPDNGAYKISIKFNDKMIDQLLSQAGRITLNKNRPLVLLWLVVESNNDMHFVGGGVHEDIADKLEELSHNYGIPMSLPLLDLPERMLITEHDVQDFNWGALKQSVGRYRANIVVAGKITNQGGIWHNKWELLDGDQTMGWETSGDDLNTQLEQMLDHLSAQVVASYTNVDKNLDTKQGLSLSVKGIKSLEDYAKVMAYLKSVTAIKKVELNSIIDDEAIFLISADGGKDSITKAISLETLLIATSAANSSGSLEYKVSS